ncbi:MAG: TrmH family RNA methyltransferase [Clostridia bacterium]|nr:TrmH family RNA methyltransferase [Clostridia bacterium]
MPSLEKYSRELDYSYTPGVFPSMEALTKRPDSVRRLLISEKLEGEGKEKLLEKCAQLRVRVEVADKALSRISGKENCFAAAVVEKRFDALQLGRHVVLHHISDAGNLGTILRTALGFGYRDLAVIRPAADSYDPRVIRASMGAIFSLRLKEYDDFESYRREFPEQQLYPFMLDGSVMLEEAVNAMPPHNSSLIFGNEGAGLPAEFAQMGKPVRIPHGNDIDSLNLSIAAAIGMYAFMNANG